MDEDRKKRFREVMKQVHEQYAGAFRRLAGIVKAAEDYDVEVRWSDEDQTFVALVPELPGCMANGAIEPEARQAAIEAIRLWLEV
jgi:hypothetical protein